MQNPEFSPEELSVLSDRNFMPLKAQADVKIKHLFNHLKLRISGYEDRIRQLFPDRPGIMGGRISKGENYKTFAYRVLDIPAFFQGEDIFALRTLLFWGHHFSIHLIIKGTTLDRFRDTLISAQADFIDGKWSLSRQEGPWEWEMDEVSHLSARDWSSENWENHISQSAFIKLSKKLNIKDYPDLPEWGEKACLEILDVLEG